MLYTTPQTNYQKQSPRRQSEETRQNLCSTREGKEKFQAAQWIAPKNAPVIAEKQKNGELSTASEEKTISINNRR